MNMIKSIPTKLGVAAILNIAVLSSTAYAHGIAYHEQAEASGWERFGDFLGIGAVMTTFVVVALF